MRIVHCIWSFNIGGAESMLVDIVNEQVKNNSVYLIIINNTYNPDLISKVSPLVRVIKIKRKPNSRSILSILKVNLILLRLLPDIVHIHNVSISRILVPLISKRCFLTIHALRIPVAQARHDVKLIAISQAVADDVKKNCNRNCVVIPNGINIAAVKHGYIVTSKDTFKIVQVGRLDVETKGQDILIEAIRLLKLRHINVQVYFIGDGGSREKLNRQVSLAGLEKDVFFMGARDRDYIYGHLCDYDLMCQPSRYEGFGLTVAEGMAAKIPVLVSDSGGPYELIQKGKYGFSFMINDPVDCARMIEELMNNREILRSKVEAAYHYVVDNFSLKRMVVSYMDEYQKALDR